LQVATYDHVILFPLAPKPELHHFGA